MRFKTHFNLIARQMQADFDKVAVAMSHAPSIGTARENALGSFLRQYLPSRFGVTSGFLVDSTEEQSKQLDIIIYDEPNTPTFFRDEHTRILPVESAYAVIEVKLRVDSTTLNEILANMLSVKRLQHRCTDISFISSGYGASFKFRPINYFFFGYTGIGLQAIGEKLAEIMSSPLLPLHMRIDGGCIFSSGVILNFNKVSDQYSVVPFPSSQIGHLETKHSLLFFYTMLMEVLAQVRLPSFAFKSYLGDMTFGQSEED